MALIILSSFDLAILTVASSEYMLKEELFIQKARYRGPVVRLQDLQSEGWGFKSLKLTTGLQ